MSSTRTVVKFQIEKANNSTLTEKVFDFPDPTLFNMSLGTVLEVNFENDCYCADFKITARDIHDITNNEGEEIKEYIYTLEYIPRTTKTKSVHEKEQEVIDDKKKLQSLLNP